MIHHLYVHIPFCPKICPYCNFYKSEASEGGFSEFVEAVLIEARRLVGKVRPQTVFFGGGTPTALSSGQLEKLIGGLREAFDFSDLVEFTVEMNPATISPGKAETLLRLGVNRASLGVQSWEPHVLTTLGRSHSAAMAERSHRILREAGFDNLNMDHIFGVPGQSPGDWARTLERTLELGSEHISAYSLTYEEDTEFFEMLGRGEVLPDWEMDAGLFETTINRLEAAGFEHYETSNYAKPGRACLHNLACWEGRDFAGLGPSAVSTFAPLRTKNVSDTREYVRRMQAGVTAVDHAENLSPADLRLEKIALGLRTSRGLSLGDLPTEKTESFIGRGILEPVGTRVRLARASRALVDEIALELV